MKKDNYPWWDDRGQAFQIFKQRCQAIGCMLIAIGILLIGFGVLLAGLRALFGG